MNIVTFCCLFLFEEALEDMNSLISFTVIKPE